MSVQRDMPPAPLAPLINALFATVPAATNDDLQLRVQIMAQEQHWQTTKLPGLSVCVLEYLHDPNPRMTALARLDVSSTGVAIPAHDLELLVQHGIIADDDSEYLHPYFLRHPRDQAGNNQNFTLHPGSQNKPATNVTLEFYIATGQLAESDNERRCINLADNSLWLPGPVENTEVMPLHMHNGNNSMLVRWLDTVSFRPRLDPLGEEVLVIDGRLSDELGIYTAGSWIRNPVASWQEWAGVAGTIIYYKNGHFDQTTSGDA